MRVTAYAGKKRVARVSVTFTQGTDECGARTNAHGEMKAYSSHVRKLEFSHVLRTDSGSEYKITSVRPVENSKCVALSVERTKTALGRGVSQNGLGKRNGLLHLGQNLTTSLDGPGGRLADSARTKKRSTYANKTNGLTLATSLDGPPHRASQKQTTTWIFPVKQDKKTKR